MRNILTKNHFISKLTTLVFLFVSLFVSLFVFFIPHLNASINDNAIIQGHVLDKIKSKPIVGAELYIDGLPQYKALSDENGNFKIEAVPEGTYNIAVRAQGFEPDFIMNIDVTEKPTEINFLLKAVTVQVEKVVVIFVEFPDLHHQAIHDEAYYKKILFSNELGVSSLRNYYYEISKGRIDIQLGKFVGWFVDRNHNMKNIEDSVRSDIADFAIHSAIGKVDFKKFDNIQNYDRVPKSDGRVDHIIIIHAGEPQSITAQKTDMNPVCMFNTEYLGEDIKTTQQVFISESAPIGNFVHEFFHDMGDRSVQDLYTGGNPPLSTVGQWEIMSVGMYNPLISLKTPYAENIGFLPSYPMPWTMGRWYHGSLKEAIGKHASVAKGQKKEFTIYPFETNSNNLKVVSVMLDETRAISVIVRQNLGFDRGLRGKGVIISKIDASLAGSMNLLGPVRIQDAHPKSPVPPYLHFTYEYELDDAAFDIGPGQNSHYESEGVRIDLKEANKDGSYRVEFEVL